MMWTQTKRIIRSGFTSFWRNRFVSLSSILVMAITLFVITELVFASALLSSTLSAVKDKVDVNVYFNKDTTEEQVLVVKGELEALPEVSLVEYVSREQALAQYKAMNADDETALKVLDELGENPLGSVLNVKARETSQYEMVASFLEQKYPEGVSIVEEVNYNKNKVIIEKLSSIISITERFGAIVTIFLIIISFIITFNTIRLSIYISKEEINVMRLVGASNSYVRGPFTIIGMLYGIVAAFVVLIVQWPIVLWGNHYVKAVNIPMDIVAYYSSNFGSMFVLLILSGIIIGGLSSYVAVRRYLSQ